MGDDETPARSLLNGAPKDVKMEDSGESKTADAKPKYKSWKKKYIKMRIGFDHKTTELDGLRKLEEKARATAKRLAMQNE